MTTHDLKQKVYYMTRTKSTQDLKTNKPELVSGKDLRYKSNWISIYNTLKLLSDFSEEQTYKSLHQKYGFKALDVNVSFEELIHQIKRIGRFMDDIERRLEAVELRVRTRRAKQYKG